MNLNDILPTVKGHWRLDVFDGDVHRKELTLDQVAENRYELECQRNQNPDGGVYLPKHIGHILDQSIQVLEGENLVTTIGKALLLDRLFSLGAPPLQVNSMGVGNSAIAADIGDTQLAGATPVPDLRPFDALPTRAGLVVNAVRTYATTEGNMNWQEMGMFNGLVNGTSVLFNRIAPIGAFNKTSAVSIALTCTLTQS